MEVGNKVKVVGTNDIWEGKSGTIVEVLDEGKYGVSIEFKEDKKVTQYFNESNLELENLQELIKEGVNMKKKINENFPDYDERKAALAKYLGVEPDEVEEGYDTNIFVADGDDYLVLTDDEADNAVYDYIENFIDDMGISGFTDYFQDWILENALDYDFDDALREDTEYYVNDIEDEGSSSFDNRLIEELYDEGILTDEDFAEDEDGEIDYSTLKDEVDLDDKKEEYIDLLVERTGDASEWFRDNFGDDAIRDLIKSGAASLDIQAIVDECISWDGRGHNLSSYDGKEIELENDLYAYRV